jgi:hypothetical protein
VETEEIHTCTNEVGESKSDSDPSVDLQDLLDIKSDDEDDPKGPKKRSGGSGNTGYSTSTSSGVDNAQKCSSQFVNEFRATLTSPSVSATSKTPETVATHLKSLVIAPVHLLG